MFTSQMNLFEKTARVAALGLMVVLTPVFIWACAKALLNGGLPLAAVLVMSLGVLFSWTVVIRDLHSKYRKDGRKNA
jgi:hypothetical protein